MGTYKDFVVSVEWWQQWNLLSLPLTLRMDKVLPLALSNCEITLLLRHHPLGSHFRHRGKKIRQRESPQDRARSHSHR